MTTTKVPTRDRLQPRPIQAVLLGIVLLCVLFGLVKFVHRSGVPDSSVSDPFTATITRVSYDQTELCYTGSPTKDGENCTALYHQEPLAVGQRVQGVEVWFPGSQGMVQVLAVNAHS